MVESLWYNLKKRLVIDHDEEVYPITNMFNSDGDETEDIYECVSFVAGRGGYWIAMAVGDDDEESSE